MRGHFQHLSPAPRWPWAAENSSLLLMLVRWKWGIFPWKLLLPFFFVALILPEWSSYNETLKVVGFSPFFLCLRSSNSLNFETKIDRIWLNGIAAFVGGPCFLLKKATSEQKWGIFCFKPVWVPKKSPQQNRQLPSPCWWCLPLSRRWRWWCEVVLLERAPHESHGWRFVVWGLEFLSVNPCWIP